MADKKKTVIPVVPEKKDKVTVPPTDPKPETRGEASPPGMDD